MGKYRVAVVGATGMVGSAFLQVFEEFKLPVSEYVLFASSKSAGKKVVFLGEEYTVQELTENSFACGFDFAVFSAGAQVSQIYAPIAAAAGCVVIDNSSCWRMDPAVPLVVPEVNPQAIARHHGIIANPNCSTIQAVLPLNLLHKKYGIERIVYSTYQAVSGAGVNGYRDLEAGIQSYVTKENYELKKFPYPIFDNCLPHIDSFTENGYTKEELKMVNETRKILEDNSLRITATAVRVPVFTGHGESINVELKAPFETEDVRSLFENSEGIVLLDDPQNNIYPLAQTAAGTNEVYVGRIRRDFSVENGLNLWVVADNIRKGAATNAIQIMKYMIEHDMA